MKIVAGLIMGFFIAALGSMLCIFAFGGGESSGELAGIMFFVFYAIAFVIAMTAKNAGKAWRRLLICTGLLFFLAPIMGLFFTGHTMADADPALESHEAAGQFLGQLLGGGIITGALGIVGFFMGVIFLVIGLLVGRDKTVVYVERP